MKAATNDCTIPASWPIAEVISPSGEDETGGIATGRLGTPAGRAGTPAGRAGTPDGNIAATEAAGGRAAPTEGTTGAGTAREEVGKAEEDGIRDRDVAGISTGAGGGRGAGGGGGRGKKKGGGGGGEGGGGKKGKGKGKKGPGRGTLGTCGSASASASGNGLAKTWATAKKRTSFRNILIGREL